MPDTTPRDPTFIFTRTMVDSWKHSDACLAAEDRMKCYCGLAALQGLVMRKAPRAPFTLHVGDASNASR